MTLPAATSRRNVWLRVGTLLDGTSTVPQRDAQKAELRVYKVR